MRKIVSLTPEPQFREDLDVVRFFCQEFLYIEPPEETFIDFLRQQTQDWVLKRLSRIGLYNPYHTLQSSLFNTFLELKNQILDNIESEPIPQELNVSFNQTTGVDVSAEDRLRAYLTEIELALMHICNQRHHTISRKDQHLLTTLHADAKQHHDAQQNAPQFYFHTDPIAHAHHTYEQSHQHHIHTRILHTLAQSWSTLFSATATPAQKVDLFSSLTEGRNSLFTPLSCGSDLWIAADQTVLRWNQTAHNGWHTLNSWISAQKKDFLLRLIEEEAQHIQNTILTEKAAPLVLEFINELCKIEPRLVHLAIKQELIFLLNLNFEPHTVESVWPELDFALLSIRQHIHPQILRSLQNLTAQRFCSLLQDRLEQAYQHMIHRQPVYYSETEGFLPDHHSLTEFFSKHPQLLDEDSMGIDPHAALKLLKDVTTLNWRQHS